MHYVVDDQEVAKRDKNNVIKSSAQKRYLRFGKRIGATLFPASDAQSRRASLKSEQRLSETTPCQTALCSQTGRHRQSVLSRGSKPFVSREKTSVKLARKSLDTNVAVRKNKRYLRFGRKVNKLDRVIAVRDLGQIDEGLVPTNLFAVSALSNDSDISQLSTYDDNLAGILPEKTKEIKELQVDGQRNHSLLIMDKSHHSSPLRSNSKISRSSLIGETAVKRYLRFG